MAFVGHMADVFGGSAQNEASVEFKEDPTADLLGSNSSSPSCEKPVKSQGNKVDCAPKQSENTVEGSWGAHIKVPLPWTVTSSNPKLRVEFKPRSHARIESVPEGGRCLGMQDLWIHESDLCDVCSDVMIDGFVAILQLRKRFAAIEDMADLLVELDKVRYHSRMPQNAGYCGGDSRSWHRYTRRPPLRSSSSFTNGVLLVEVLEALIDFTASTRDTYALVLLHSSRDHPTHHFSDDLLLPFRVRSPAEAVPQSVMSTVSASNFNRRGAHLTHRARADKVRIYLRESTEEPRPSPGRGIRR